MNVINGDYCEVMTDLIIAGPDALLLQRFYSNDNGWKIFPQRFLVVGRDRNEKSCVIGKERFEWVLALTGERSGGIFPYSGWRNTNQTTKDPLKIDVLNRAIGMVNTYAKEINGQTNHQNNQLHCKNDTCELTLGDGTKRIYKKVKALPSLLLGEELTPSMGIQVLDPSYFLLAQEVLPSGNQLFFSYDQDNHLISVEMKNASCSKIISWISFSYEFKESDLRVHIETSDDRKLIYHFLAGKLIHVDGSHAIPITYAYDGNLLVKKTLPQGRFIDLSYKDGKVQTFKGPHAQTGKPEDVHTFYYAKGYTDVWDVMGVRTRYIYDSRSQLTAIERYDNFDKLYRIEQKFWGKTKSDAGLLLAKTIGDGNGRIYSYHSFGYDRSGNVLQDRLYGNLTGKQEVSLEVSSDGLLINSEEEECHLRTFGYSIDGFNLLTRVGDSKGNQTLYTYQPGTNLLVRKLIYDKGIIKKRTFQHYNEDAVCIKIIEDEGCTEKEANLDGYGIIERHIKEIKPKTTLPGVGLPEVIEQKSLDVKAKKEIIVSKTVNHYDSQSHLLSCDTYDTNNQYAFTEKRTYTLLGQIASQTDAIGRETFYTYDEMGNEIARFTPHENKSICTSYDFHNKPIQITESNADEQITLYKHYDNLGRTIGSTDRFGQTTHYEYDAFHRLTKVIHPEVLDEKGEISQPTFVYTYDIFGNVLTVTDAKGFITTKTYNLRGDPTKISYPDASYELFKYDPEGSLHRSFTRDQIITVYEYDYLGRPIYEEISTSCPTGVSSFVKSKSYQYNGFRCTYEKENDHAKLYSFDPAGRMIAITEYEINQNNKRVSEFSYDSLGRAQQRKVWFDQGPQDYTLECYSYDLAGNVIEKRIEDATHTILLQKYFTYNLKGQCEEEYILENGVKQTLLKTLYNSQGEATCYIDGLQNTTKVIIDNHFINALGQTVLKKFLVNPVGIQTEMEFDVLGRLYSVTKKDPFGVLLSSERHLHDALGNPALDMYDQIIDGKIIGVQKAECLYGPMGRLEEKIQAADSPLAKKTYYEYNSLGQLINKNSSELLTHYIYNKDGNLHKVASRNSKDDSQISNSYSYDRKGNIISAHSLRGKSVQRSYNVFNQITEETIQDGEGSYTLEYTYDRKGRLTSITLPDQSKISYTYDALFGREVKRISPKGDVLYTHTYDSYDIQGKLLLEHQIGYAGSHEHTYNLNGQKTSCKNDFFHEEYERDILGRITEVKGEKPQQYTYNHLSQLTSDKKSTYNYDSLDNRIQINNEALVYNTLNQLVSQSSTEFSYDAQGNLLRKVLDGEETHFESNHLSQLVSIKKPDQTALTFSYDPFGRLLIEKHLNIKGKNKRNLSTTRYLYLGNQEIGTLSATGEIETLKVPGLHGDQLASTSIAFEIKGEVYLPLHDIAGNVTHLINPQERQIVESYAYTAFGKECIFNDQGEQVETSPTGNPWRFAEKRIDEQSGLILFGLRFYDPSIGRWISQDPAADIDGPNLYAYLHNNPVNHIDRFGLATESFLLTFDQYFFNELETHCYCEKHRTCKRGGDIGKTTGSSLPTITYYDTFEQYHKDLRCDDIVIENYYESSTCYDLSNEGLPDLPKDLGIGFVNGIWNNFKGSKGGARYVSRLAGDCNIHGVFNATHGNDVDLQECIYNLNYIATEPVKQLHNMWNSFFERNSPDAKFLMICHSQGAIHVRNALLDYPPELRKRILVVAIAPAAYIYSETCAKVIHYRAEALRDFVPRIDKAGAKREKDTIITLQSDKDAALFDHEFQSPTYREVVKQHIENYINSQGKML